MKLSKIKLRWKIFAYILIFAAIVIAIFCVFQILLLDSMYRSTKKESVISTMEDTSNVVENNKIDNVRNDLLNTANEKEVAIYLFAPNGDLIGNFGMGNYLSSFMNHNVFMDIINKSQSVKNSIFFISFNSDISKPVGNSPMVNKTFMKSTDEAIICGRYVTYQGLQNCLLIIDTRLTPVEPAVQTLKQQLLYISLIVVVVAIIVALFVSSTISKPIKKMTEEANLLAKGERDIEFNGKGFSEISDLNHALNYAVSELKKTSTLQKELLANISHDLKTPLTLISGYAEMMRDMPEEINANNLQLVIDEVNRLNVLVNDLLNLSRLQAKTETFNISTYNLTSIIRSIVDRQRLFHEKDGFIFSFNYDCEVFAKVDEHKISQVIYNFINNAITYSGESKKIDIYQEINENEAKITIRDFGVGIKTEELECIWNRYYRVDKGHQRSTQGSGLGLSIVKEILEYHGFKYGVNSVIGEGSSFYFIVPIERKEEKI